MRRALVVAALVLASASAAAAQSWEISALGGYTPSVDLERQARGLDEVAIGGGFTWTFQATKFFTPHWGAQVNWSEQPSSLDVTVGDETAELFSMTASQLHANAVYRFGAPDARMQPFVFGGVGATFFRARDLPSETKLSMSAGGGVRVFPWSSVGLVGQLRYKPTWLNDEEAGDFCDPFGFCQGSLRQFELAAGVVLRF